VTTNTEEFNQPQETNYLPPVPVVRPPVRPRQHSNMGLVTVLALALALVTGITAGAVWQLRDASNVTPLETSTQSATTGESPSESPSVVAPTPVYIAPVPVPGGVVSHSRSPVAEPTTVPSTPDSTPTYVAPPPESPSPSSTSTEERK